MLSVNKTWTNRSNRFRRRNFSHQWMKLITHTSQVFRGRVRVCVRVCLLMCACISFCVWTSCAWVSSTRDTVDGVELYQNGAVTLIANHTHERTHVRFLKGAARCVLRNLGASACKHDEVLLRFHTLTQTLTCPHTNRPPRTREGNDRSADQWMHLDQM